MIPLVLALTCIPADDWPREVALALELAGPNRPEIEAFLARHRDQAVTLGFHTHPQQLRRFDREGAEWVDLEWDGDQVSFEVASGTVELLPWWR